MDQDDKVGNNEVADELQQPTAPLTGGPSRSIPSIPTDNETKQKILDIIDHQFDLEIYLKQREVETIRQEIAKAERTLQDLNQAIQNETLAAALPETVHYTRRSAQSSYFPPVSTYFPASTSASTPPPPVPPPPSKKKLGKAVQKTQLYGRRNDGVYVRLACPACQRDDFANQQGFLNHCRLAHNLEFGPYEQIMLRCGTPVDESEVPLDHPARTRPVTKPVSTKSLSLKKKARPTIKVFEEDVDLELDQDKQGKKATTTSAIVTVPDIPTTPDAKESAESRTDIGDLAPEPRSPASPAPRHKEAFKSLPDKTTQQPSKGEETASSMDEKHGDKEQTAEPGDAKAQSDQNQPVESFAAALSSTDDAGSRFYIKRRIIVGNVSKFIAPEKRDPTLSHFTHKWMIYVVEPPQTQELAAFITGVRFHLHPSYKPHDVIDVTEPPFRLTRLGWGEFPIRIQLFFVDKRRNKSVDIIHILKLDDFHSGKQVLGSERSIDIELDRNTDFKDVAMSPVSRASSVPVDEKRPAGKDGDSSTTSSLEVLAAKQKMSLLHSILRECVRRLPVIRADGHHTPTLPYTCATSSRVYFNWSVGRRKALEWHRAHVLRIQVQQRAFETKDDVLRKAASMLTTKDTVLWCREHRFTPQKSDPSTLVAEEITTLGYCKFCGCNRASDHQGNMDECPRRPKAWSTRKRYAGINSITSVTGLLTKLEPGWDEEKETDDMDIDVDVNAAESSKASASTSRSSVHQQMIDRIRDWKLTQHMDVANERTLDWIWSVVGQLQLKGMIANDMAVTRDGQVQRLVSGLDLQAAMEQRLVVGTVLTEAMRVFLKKLLSASTDIYKKEQETDDGDDKMLVPYHVYQAIHKNEELDFLTNQYLGPEKKDLTDEEMDPHETTCTK